MTESADIHEDISVDLPAHALILKRTVIHAQFQVEGFHRWPEAEGRRAYLADRHRHHFRYKASVSVGHNDREIEFHDFLDWCIENAMKGELGRSSSEDMANDLAEKIRLRWPDRPVYQVEVWEDDQVGCTVKLVAG